MFEAENVLGPLTRLQAEAIGQPGQRKFRLLVQDQNERAAVIWLEKEQLQALGLAVEQLLANLHGSVASRSAPLLEPPSVATFPVVPNMEFTVGRLAIGEDERELEAGPRYVLLAYDVESLGENEGEGGEPRRPATLACRATRDQLRALSRNVSDVVSAGRPRCPLCGEPVQTLTQPHGCARTNGHHA